MGILTWFRKKKAAPVYTLTDEDRAKSLEIRQMQAQVDRLERKLELKQHLVGLSDMISELNGDSKEDSMEKMFLPLLMGAFNKNSNQNLNMNSQGMNGDMYGSQEAAVTNPSRNAMIANLLKNKIPKEYQQQLNELSDGDILDIKQRITS